MSGISDHFSAFLNGTWLYFHDRTSLNNTDIWIIWRLLALFTLPHGSFRNVFLKYVCCIIMDSILSIWKQHKTVDCTKLFWIKSQPRCVHSASPGPSLGCASGDSISELLWASAGCHLWSSQVLDSVLPGSSLPKHLLSGFMFFPWIHNPRLAKDPFYTWAQLVFLLVSTRTFLTCSGSLGHCFWFPR